MADAKITALTENTTPITTDILPMVDDPGGTPATQKVQIANLLSTGLLKNPYKFSAYRNSAQNAGSAAYAVVNFDTEDYDTGNNFSVAGTVGRFTAPVAGYYYFDAQVKMQTSTDQYPIAALYKNGTIVLEGNKDYQTSHFIHTSRVSGALSLAANDFIDVYSYGDGGALLVGTARDTRFSGFLISVT